MALPTSDDVGEQQPPIATARHRFRRASVIWLISSLLIYCSWDVVDQLVLEAYSPLVSILLDWGVMIVGASSLVFAINRREDQRFVVLEALARERRDRERAKNTLDTVRATARAVAHNLNQPLAVIRASAELIQTAPPGESSEADVAAILVHVDRAATLVRDLFNVTRFETRLAADGRPMLDLSQSVTPPTSLE